ncbi:hypothetical protein [Weissella muntiaci]|nr:hypothetical protein [Weissella muntiaci]
MFVLKGVGMIIKVLFNLLMLIVSLSLKIFEAIFWIALVLI